MASETARRLELVISWLKIWYEVRRNGDVETQIQRHVDLIVKAEQEKVVSAALRAREQIAFAKQRREVDGNIRRCQAFIDSVVRGSVRLKEQ